MGVENNYRGTDRQSAGEQPFTWLDMTRLTYVPVPPRREAQHTGHRTLQLATPDSFGKVLAYLASWAAAKAEVMCCCR